MRLNTADRDFLIKKVKESVFDTFSKELHERLLEACAKDILISIDKNCPEKDMKVLSKYGLTAYGDTVEVGKDTYNVKALKLPRKVYRPRLSATDGYYQYAVIDVVIYEKIKASEKRLSDANDVARQPYKDLINGSTTWEQIITVWKEAEQWMPKKGQALVAVSQATKSFIAQDSKTRKWV